MARNIIFVVIVLFGIPDQFQGLALGTKCFFKMNQKSLYYPAIKTINGTLWPEYNLLDSQYVISMESGTVFTMECLGINNHFKFLKDQTIQAICVEQSLIRVPTVGYVRQFEEFVCQKATDSIVERIGPCLDTFDLLRLTTPAGEEVLQACHNTLHDETLYAMHYLRGGDLNTLEPTGDTWGYPRGYYTRIMNPTNSYTPRDVQRQAARFWLGDGNEAEFGNPGANYFFARGHFVPCADKLQRHKGSTYNYINASPQWQIINRDNWGEHGVEGMVRDLARRSPQVVFTIYTGSYQYLERNNERLWLGRNRQTDTYYESIPVAKYTWKIVFDQLNNATIVYIVHNDPYNANVPICTDVCPHFPNLKRIPQGYVICCTLENFLRVVGYPRDLQKIGNVKLLSMDMSYANVNKPYYHENNGCFEEDDIE